MGALQGSTAHLFFSLLVSARASLPCPADAGALSRPFPPTRKWLTRQTPQLDKKHWHVTLGTSSSKIPTCAAGFLVPAHRHIPLCLLPPPLPRHGVISVQQSSSSVVQDWQFGAAPLMAIKNWMLHDRLFLVLCSCSTQMHSTCHCSSVMRKKKNLMCCCFTLCHLIPFCFC